MADIERVDRKLAIHFRFVGIPSEHLPRVREVLGDRIQVANRRAGTQRGLVIAMPLDESFPTAAVASLVQEIGLTSDRYGVYISLVTASDQDGLTVPESTLRVIREVGGQLDFSFTCTG